MISYQTAFLKANHPVDFMAGVLACELGNSDKLSHFIGECSEMGISVLDPMSMSRVKISPAKFKGNEKGSIRFGLATGMKELGTLLVK